MQNSVNYEFTTLTEKSLSQLSQLNFSSKGTRRLCLHENNDSNLHMMVIDIMPNAYYKYHSHSLSDEIVILLSGSLHYIYETGEKISLSINGNQSSIIPKTIAHSVQAGSKGARYIEIIRGPFRPEDKSISP